MDEIRLSVAAWAPGSYRLMNVVQEPHGRRGDRRARRARDGPQGRRPHLDRRRARAPRASRSPGSSRIPARSLNNRSYLDRHRRRSSTARGTTSTGAITRSCRRTSTSSCPKGWKIATGLTPTFDPIVYHANDTDWLLDCPVLMGQDRDVDVRRGGVPHRVAFDNRGQAGRVRRGRSSSTASARSSKTTTDLWGQIPYPHYTFIFSAGGGGGLEHLTSTTIGVEHAALAAEPERAPGRDRPRVLPRVEREAAAAEGPRPVRLRRPRPDEEPLDQRGHHELLHERRPRARRADRRGRLPRAATRGTIGGVIANPAIPHRSLPRRPRGPSGTRPYLGGPISYYTQGEYPRPADGSPDPRRDQEPEEPRRRDAAPLRSGSRGRAASSPRTSSRRSTTRPASTSTRSS